MVKHCSVLTYFDAVQLSPSVLGLTEMFSLRSGLERLQKLSGSKMWMFFQNRGTKYPKMDDLFIIRKTLLRFGWFGGNTPVVDNILVTGCLEVSCHWRKHVTLVLETFWKPPRVANWSQAIHKPGVLFFFFNWRILFVYGGFLKWWVSPTNHGFSFPKYHQHLGCEMGGKTHHVRKHPYIHKRYPALFWRWTCWRCISLLKMGFSIAILVYQRVFLMSSSWIYNLNHLFGGAAHPPNRKRWGFNVPLPRAPLWLGRQSGTLKGRRKRQFVFG